MVGDWSDRPARIASSITPIVWGPLTVAGKLSDEVRRGTLNSIWRQAGLPEGRRRG